MMRRIITDFIHRNRRMAAMVAIVATVAGSLWWLTARVNGLRKENRELNARLSVAMMRQTAHPDTVVLRGDTVTVTKTVSTGVSAKEYRRLLSDIDELKAISLKAKDIIQQTVVANETRDTVWLTHSADSMEMTYDDRWTHIHVNGRKLDYQTRDSLAIYLSRIYKHRFLFWRWGTKGCRVSVVNYNPRSRLTYQHSVKVEE